MPVAGRGERRLAQRPRAVVAEVRDREPDDPVADLALEQRPDDRRLGDVLNAVDVRVRSSTATARM